MRALPAALLASLVLALAGCGGDGEAACSEYGPPQIAVAGDAVWVAQGATLHRLAPGTGAIDGATRVLPARRGSDLGAIAPNGMGVVLGTTRTAIGVTAEGAVASRARRRPPAYPSGMAAAGGRTLLAAGRRLLVLAPDGSLAARSPRLPARVVALAVDGDRAWAGGSGYVIGLDARTARPIGVRGTASPSPGALWALRREGAVLRRLDPDDGHPIGAPLELGDAATTLVAVGGAVWVGLRHPSVVRVDPGAVEVTWRRDIPYT